MALKTFNVDDAVYKTYSKHCKKNGISMSRQIENFLRKEIENMKIIAKEPEKIEERISFSAIKEHPLRKYC
jgi:hypothetical protein